MMGKEDMEKGMENREKDMTERDMARVGIKEDTKEDMEMERDMMERGMVRVDTREDTKEDMEKGLGKDHGMVRDMEKGHIRDKMEKMEVAKEGRSRECSTGIAGIARNLDILSGIVQNWERDSGGNVHFVK